MNISCSNIKASDELRWILKKIPLFFTEHPLYHTKHTFYLHKYTDNPIVTYPVALGKLEYWFYNVSITAVCNIFIFLSTHTLPCLIFFSLSLFICPHYITIYSFIYLSSYPPSLYNVYFAYEKKAILNIFPKLNYLKTTCNFLSPQTDFKIFSNYSKSFFNPFWKY